MSSIHYYCLDLETTGTMIGYAEICELSIIRATDRMQLTRNVRVENPQNASWDALKIIGRSMDDLKSGVSSKQIINEVENLVNEDGVNPSHRCLVGHNIVGFDRRFLWHLWEKHNKKFPFDLFLDTMQMFRAHSKKIGIQKPKVNLSIACETMGITKLGTAHTAKFDTRNTFLLWQKLKNSVDYLQFIKNMPHSIENQV